MNQRTLTPEDLIDYVTFRSSQCVFSISNQELTNYKQGQIPQLTEVYEVLDESNAGQIVKIVSDNEKLRSLGKVVANHFENFPNSQPKEIPSAPSQIVE